jgi:3-oxoacyl-[acyl-carrier-protein] synthase-3
MAGMDVFNFGLRVVPKSIKEILNYAETAIEDVDLILFHQANKFMTDFFAKKLKFPLEKVPYSLQYFGNTSAASIPLNVLSQMQLPNYPQRKNVIMTGFGAGLSWGTCLLSLENTKVSELIED